MFENDLFCEGGIVLHAVQSRRVLIIKVTGLPKKTDSEGWVDATVLHAIFNTRSRLACSDFSRSSNALLHLMTSCLFFAMRCTSAEVSWWGVEDGPSFPHVSITELSEAQWRLGDWRSCWKIEIESSTHSGPEAEEGDDRAAIARGEQIVGLKNSFLIVMHGEVLMDQRDPKLIWRYQRVVLVMKWGMKFLK